LEVWLKFYEAITKPLPVASALFLSVSTSFLLFASDPTLARLGLSRVVTNYRWAVGLGFVIALTWLVVTGLLWFARWSHHRAIRFRTIHQDKLRVEAMIPQMSPREREIVGCLLQMNQRMFTNTPDGGHAVTLVSKGVVRLALKPGQTFPYYETPYEIPEHIWSVLEKHKSEFPYEDEKNKAHPWRIHWMER
jgi:Super-infection exclusion protein B